MVELKIGLRTVDLPYSVRLPGVSESLFDELVDEDTRAELIDGVMIVHSPASIHHDDLAGFLRALLRMYAADKALGKVLGPDALVRLAAGRKFGPDWFFLEQKRVPRRWRHTEFRGVPDFVGEVLSPSNRSDDLEDKRPAYQEAGVPEIWWVDPDKQEIVVDRRVRRRYTTSTVADGWLESSAVTGFGIDVGWLWEEPLPNEMACLRSILE